MKTTTTINGISFEIITRANLGNLLTMDGMTIRNQGEKLPPAILTKSGWVDATSEQWEAIKQAWAWASQVA
jgi:hypothetical protein